MSTALQVDDRAFEALYRVHRHQVYAYALATLRNPTDAEDATQTTFLKALSAFNRGMDPRETASWLIGITKNVCRDRFREAKRQPIAEPLNDWIKAHEPQDTRFSFEDLCREILALSPRQRRILVMREFEGRSFGEISQELGVTPAAAQALLVRARREIRAELELPMTCEQSRRATVRNLNGVATLEERRALKMHMRRCAECSKFVGRNQRGIVRAALFLPFFPFRRLTLLASASSGQTGSTAAGVAGLGVKLATITAAGAAAVSTTAISLDIVPTATHTRSAPAAAHHVSTVRRNRAGSTLAPYSATAAVRVTTTGHNPYSSVVVKGRRRISAQASPDLGRSSPTVTAHGAATQPDSGMAPNASAQMVEATSPEPELSSLPESLSTPLTPDPNQTSVLTPGVDQVATTEPGSSPSPAGDQSQPLNPTDGSTSDPSGTPPSGSNDPGPPPSPPTSVNTSNQGKALARAVGQGGTPPGLANKPPMPPGQTP